MNEPRRWKDSPSAPIGMRELLGAARPTRALEPAVFRRGGERIAKLSLAPAAAVAAISVWSKLAAAGALGLIAVGIVYGGLARHVTLPPPAPPSERPAANAPATLPTLAIPVPEPARTDSAPAAVMPRRSATARPVASHVDLEPIASSANVDVPPPSTRAKSTLGDELEMLEAAKRDMPANPTAALATLAEHRTRYASGLLAAERNLMELDALRRVGRVREARELARAWLERDPRGLHAERVRRILNALETNTSQ